MTAMLQLRNCSKRLFEWTTTGMMLGIAATLFVSPHSISRSAFRLLLDVLPQEMIADLLFVFGVARVIALVANGSIPIYGPIMRSACAAGGAVMWGQFGIALIGQWSLQDHLSPGVTIYFFMTLGEMASCYRAASDGRRYRLR